jgi:mono/diheme cytochrome c family protein
MIFRSLRTPFALLAAWVVVAPTFGKLPPEQLAQLPVPASRPVDFARDIQPLFEASCVQCHARGKSKGNFSLETRADFLAGGDAGAPAVAGHSAESYLIEMVSGLNPEIVMPQKGKKLTREQVALFRAWVDQGMPWPEEITFFKREPANLRPRELAQIQTRGDFSNPVDVLVDRYFARHGRKWAEPVDDRTYARRVWLDTVGLLPSPGELDGFIKDTAADKRARLVERLLSDNQRYAEHWLTFWNDMLRNDYKGPGYTDGGRKQITGWVYAALARNLPYEQFVAQLINPGADAEGFTKGILWRGAVNASMVPPMQAAQGIAQVFLGVNLKCASCHDSFINEYTLDDSYGLASIYADGPLEIAECDKPTGHMARVKFLYDELGEINPQATPVSRKEQLVEIITGRKNGRLPRTIVNRLWQRFMGYGLVEPVDEMDKPAWSPEIMDWLAEDLVAHDHDLKHTMRRILTSRAYQLPSVSLGETEENYVFRGPAVRRLSAEQFSDAVYALTRQKHDKADGKLNRLAALKPGHDELTLEPKWIWGAPDAHLNAKPATMIFRRTINLPAAPTSAHFAICGDDNYSIRINGKAAGSTPKRNATYADWVDVRSHLRAGENTIEITVANMPPDEGRLVSVKMDELPDSDSPAGLIVYARVRVGDESHDFVTDRTWNVHAFPKPPATTSVALSGDQGEPRDVGRAIELGGVELAPWKVGLNFLDLAAAPKDTLPVERASLVTADPLTIALGRPNREQVITVRATTATTLQALELTNGATLAQLLKVGGDKILTAFMDQSPRSLIQSLYLQALGRTPNDQESKIAEGLVGSPARCDGVEDLLWALTMLPEFQLIY